jgi:Kef-type K+ transport system membrane component KefB
MPTVLLTTFLCGSIARKLGQARVIGEIIGRILIGPSALGRIAPHASARLFPPESLGPIEVLSTVGLILFLFLIGSELNYGHLGQQKRTTILAIGMSRLFPFLMAAVVTSSLYIRFAPSSIGRVPFFLFLGISMSITAFPVLARILHERNLQSTPLATTALMCAAVDDVIAWILLGVALTLIPHSGRSIPSMRVLSTLRCAP